MTLIGGDQIISYMAQKQNFDFEMCVKFLFSYMVVKILFWDQIFIPFQILTLRQTGNETVRDYLKNHSNNFL